MTNEHFKKLQAIYSALRDADRLVCTELGKEYTEEDVKNMDKSFTDYYHAVEEIRHDVGLLLDELQGRHQYD